jgi:ubiquinone/menaquinone biosynthesis C-methylase UbiE/uncharacterized protein YbaR (Trm112 family)
MKSELINILRCPKTKNKLFLEESINKGFDIESGNLVTKDRKFIYPIMKGVPRFVGESNYADNFGMQWNHFSKTQLDSYSGHSISSDRFWKATGWKASEIRDKWVLDVGCGSGRFAEVALSAGAKVVAMDYSSAVDACYDNFFNHPNLYVVQGDIYELPFDLKTFSYIYSLGVLQHTPDPEQAFNSLHPLLPNGGRLCVDYYEKSWKSLFLPKYWLRPFTKRIPKKTLFQFIKNIIPFLLPLSRLLGLVPFIGHKIKKIIPVANYYGVLPLNDLQQKEWSLLDTFDWLSPEHDHPQTSKKAKLWMQNADFEEIEVLKAGHLVARGKKK